MVLLQNRGDRQEVLRELRRAREALNDVLDRLAVEGLDPETDISRRDAELLREHVDAVAQEVSATRQ